MLVTIQFDEENLDNAEIEWQNYLRGLLPAEVIQREAYVRSHLPVPKSFQEPLSRDERMILLGAAKPENDTVGATKK